MVWIVSLKKLYFSFYCNFSANHIFPFKSITTRHIAVKFLWVNHTYILIKTVLAFFHILAQNWDLKVLVCFRKKPFESWIKHAVNERWKIKSKNPRTVLYLNMYIIHRQINDNSTMNRLWLKRIWSDLPSSNLNTEKMAIVVFSDNL